jgi:NAD-dependent dihydropyrimidine dehydrogenase PreA subunit
MIELVSDERCTRCDRCVRVCPTNVFDLVPGRPPVIARADDCQTCFMCEIYCPSDALFVHPAADRHVAVDEEEVTRQGWWGQYRRDSGWGVSRRDPSISNQSWRMDEIFAAARALGGPTGAGPIGAQPTTDS